MTELLPGRRPRRPARERLEHVHPTRDDGVVASLSEVVGGPVGDRATFARWGTPLAVLLLVTAVTFAVGMASKNTCASRDWSASSTATVQYSHLCASDIPTSWTDSGLAQLAWPWTSDAQVRARYGVTTEPALVGLWEYGAARVAYVLHGSPDLGLRYDTASTDLDTVPGVATERALFVGVNAVGLGLLAMLATAALSLARRRRPWDAAAFAAAPVLAVAGLVGFDLIGVAATAGALWCWSRGRVAWGGALVGLGAAAAVWPALLLPALALNLWRRAPVDPDQPPVARLADLLPATVAALAAWMAANAPAFLTGRTQWEAFWRVAIDRGPSAGSFFTIIDQSAGITAGTAIAWSWALLVIWWAGVGLLCLWSRVPPRLTQVAFLLVAGVLLFEPTYRPQDALWLLPLAALARPRWRDQLIWQAGEVLWFGLYGWLRGGELEPGAGGAAGFSWIGIGVRLACTLWLVAMVVRDVAWAEHDPVLPERLGMADGADDVVGLVDASGQVMTTASNAVVV